MTTDYSKLNRFDALAVVLVFVGLVIVGCEIFIALPQQHKHELKSALQIMDLHEQAQEQGAVAIHVLDSIDRFYSETYVAFGEVWNFPNFMGDWEKRTGRTLAAFGSVSEQIASGYESNMAYFETAYDEGGQVLGASVEQVVEGGVITEQSLDAFTDKILPYQGQPLFDAVRHAKLNLVKQK